MKNLKKLWIALAALLGAGIGILTALNAFADAPPAISITSLSSNQFSIIVTNGTTNTTYGLYWTPVINDPDNYPWTLLSVGSVGQTNWTVDGGEWSVSFFRILTGTDLDNDGIVNWQDANPTDPNVGILDVTISSPLNGAVLQ